MGDGVSQETIGIFEFPKGDCADSEELGGDGGKFSVL